MANYPDLTQPYFKKIEPDFGLGFARWIENYHLLQIGNTVNGVRARMATNYQYARGDQSYLASTVPLNNLTDNPWQTMPGEDLTNMQLVPSLIEAVVGKMIKTQLKPTVTMIDSFAMKDRLDIKARMEMMMEMERQGAELDTVLQQFGMTRDQIPMDNVELQIKLDCLPQFVEEMEIELALADIANSSKIDVLRKMILADFLIAPARVGYYIERINGKRQIERLEPMNYGSSWSFYEDGRDIVMNYRIKPVSLEVVRQDAGGFIDPEKLKALRGGMFSRLQTGYYIWNNNGYGTTDYYSTAYMDDVLVMDFDFVTTDTLYTHYKDGQPYPPTYEKKNPGADKEVRTSAIQNLISGKYICGTDLLYNYGVVKDAVRQPIITGANYTNRTNPDGSAVFETKEAHEMTMADAKKVNAQKVYSNFVTYQANMIQGISKSKLDAARPHMDALETTFKKAKKYTEKFIPWMAKFDQAAMADIITKEGAEPVAFDDFVTTALEYGYIIGDSGKLRGMYTASFKEAFTIEANDGGPNLQMLWNMVFQQITLIRDIFGVPNVFTGAAPVAEQGKAVTERQLEGADNAFSGIAFAEIKLSEMLYENLMWDVIRTGAQGVVNGRPFNVPLNNPMERIPNLKVEMLPTQQEWAELLFMANEDKAKGYLDDSDIIMLKIIDNLKQAQAYLITRVNREKKRQAQLKADDIKRNGEEQRASLELAERIKKDAELLKQMGEMQKVLAEGYTKALDEFAKAAMTPRGEGQAAFNIEEAKASLQFIKDQLEEVDKRYGKFNREQRERIAA